MVYYDYYNVYTRAFKVTQMLEVRSRVAILLFWTGFATSLTHKYHTSGIF